MPGSRFGFDPKLTQKCQRCQTSRPNGRLGNLCGAQIIFLMDASFRRKRRLRIDIVAQSIRGRLINTLGENLVRFHQHIEHHWKSAGQFAEHSDIL